MPLHTLVDRDLIFPDLPAFDAATVLRAFADRIVATGKLSNAEALYEALWEREQLGSTGIGQGVAVPHCKLGEVDDVLVAVGHIAKPIDFGAVDGQPVQLFFVVISPEAKPAAHLQGLAAISRWVQESPGGVDRLVGISDPDALHAALQPGS